MHRNLQSTLLVAWVIITIAACSPAGGGKGTLSGHVTIGPLTPVVHAGQPGPTPSPEMYAAWEIVVYTPDMQREIARTSIDASGNYRVSLPPGIYMVTAERTSGGRGPGGAAKHKVEISEGEVTHLDLSIDTGIR
jgi:hypothetical protein